MKNDPLKTRFTKARDGKPAMLVCLQLTQEDAANLVTWFVTRAAELKGNRWRGWCAVDSALRTLVFQIEAYHQRAFGVPFPNPAKKQKAKPKS